jgi:hypothetical protein
VACRSLRAATIRISSRIGTDPQPARADPSRFIARPIDAPFDASEIMNYPLLPVDAAAYAWQVSCCIATLIFAMFSWMIGPR